MNVDEKMRTPKQQRVLENQRRWRSHNRERAKFQQWAYELKKFYGITVQEYEQRLEEQDGRCAICLQLPPGGEHLCVDHDHDTNKVRGLLCRFCNLGIGMFNEDAGRLLSAERYIQLHNKPQLVAA